MKKIIFLTTAFFATIGMLHAQNNRALQINSDGTSFLLSGMEENLISNLTIEGWVKIDEATTVDNYTALVDFRNSADVDSKALIFKTLNGSVTTSYEWYNNWTYEGVDNIVPLGEWAHIAVVISGDDLVTRFYINGYLTGENSSYTGLGDELPLGYSIRVGAGLAAESFRTFLGLMDEIRIWTVPRTEDELLENMDKEIDPLSDGLLMYYRCNEEETATVLTDATGNGFDLSAVGTMDYVFVDDDLPFVVSQSADFTRGNGKSLLTFPIPANDQLHFAREFRNAQVEVYNIAGQIVKKDELNDSSLYIADIKSGIYTLIIKEGNQIYFEKFMKK
ncbi:MAG TPA: T9SS type A sorting domain-containing protein [Prolixibacteraceae bacterium]|nr:T9SS type A sorting domain-containing protein [Prolixibacteraceae bacterium]